MLQGLRVTKRNLRALVSARTAALQSGTAGEMNEYQHGSVHEAEDDAYLLGMLWLSLREKILTTFKFWRFFTAMVHQRPLHVPTD